MASDHPLAHIAPIALTMGDPAGCGPQISSSALAGLNESGRPPLFAIGVPDAFSAFGPIEIISTPKDVFSVESSRLPVLPVFSEFTNKVISGQGDPANAQPVIEAIETAVSLTLSGEASAVVTNPINKAVLYAAGFNHPGHTEFLAALCNPAAPPKPVMMLVGGGLRVALATIHTSLRSVPHLLTQELLVEIGTITNNALQRGFAVAEPKIAFTGLNPHAGESGTIGTEEIDIINPAAATLRAAGINISDARSADTLFAETLGGAFDAVIAMTHDQGLIPVKTLDFWGGVNVTLGLPIVRTSPDHGTAYEAAAAQTARPDSLIAAIRLAAEIAHNRSRLGSGTVM